MTPQFLQYYNTELQHIRMMAAEFARAYPKIAARLDLDRDGKETCPDPFVERLLEGFAYMAARTRLKLDAEFPRFTQALLETVHPEYLCPVPSMAIVRFSPDFGNKSLYDGFTVPRGTLIRSHRTKEEVTPCTYRTAHEIKLWPVRITDARYLDRSIDSIRLPEGLYPAAALHIVLQCNAETSFDALPMDELTFYIRGSEGTPQGLMEHLFAHGMGVWMRDGSEPDRGWTRLPEDAVRPVGLQNDEALIPSTAPGFEGYRLLREYFSFPQRFLFFAVKGLKTMKVRSQTLELAFTLKTADANAARNVTGSYFELYCSPVVNLFEKRTDRVEIEQATTEHHVVVDRTRPLDYEVYRINRVLGYGDTPGEEHRFHSFYRTRDEAGEATAFYTLYRRLRTPNEKERTYGRLTSYLGSEVYLSLVDTVAAPYPGDIRQLGISALCTNRHLPIRLSQSGRTAQFALEINGPVASVECLSGPTSPQPSFAMGETAWRIISHLSLNYFSLTDSPNQEGASALRDLLKLYVPPEDRAAQLQIEGLLSVQHRLIIRRVPAQDFIVFARGLEVTVTFDEEAFVGTGIFLLGMVLEQFFARHVSINAFTETVIRSKQRGEIVRWPARAGRKTLT